MADDLSGLFQEATPRATAFTFATRVEGLLRRTMTTNSPSCMAKKGHAVATRLRYYPSAALGSHAAHLFSVLQHHPNKNVSGKWQTTQLLPSHCEVQTAAIAAVASSVMLHTPECAVGKPTLESHVRNFKDCKAVQRMSKPIACQSSFGMRVHSSNS